MNVILRRRDGFSMPVSLRPLSVDRTFQKFVDSVLQEFMNPSSAAPQEPLAISPRINVTETEKSYEVEAELPGVVKENLKISAEDGRITVEAEVKRAFERKEGENVTSEERVVRKFARSFSLAAEIDDSKAVAKLENGVLTLTLPKAEARQAHRIAVQ